MSTTPYAFIKHGNLFIAPVGSSINEVPYPPQSVTKPREFSLWVHGKVEEPEFQLDKARMPPSMYQEVRKDLSKYSSVPVSRSAFRRSQHAYVGVIDSRGKPYYFALDSRGFSCREASINDDHVWKTFDHLAGEEQLMAIKQRRQHADEEMEQVDRELSKPLLVISKGFMTRKEDGTPIKKPSIYQKLRGLVGKPRTDITDAGDDVPKMPKMKLLLRASCSCASNPKGDVIPGGLADKKSPSDFDPKKLAAGAKVEREHTSSRTVASEIARDHLVEDPDYYKKLKKIEKDMTAGGSPQPMKPRVVGKQATEAQQPSLATRLVAVRGDYARRTGDNSIFPSSRKPVAAMDYSKMTKPPVVAKKSIEPALVLMIEKALPKKSKEEPVKKPKPTSGASKKQMGAGGKTRYTYLQEGKAKLPKPTPLVVAPSQEEKQNVDPSELANQLGVSKLTLTKIASKLGRKGFSRYMRSHLKRFAAKHGLGHDYWDQIYGTVVQNTVQNEEKAFDGS